MVRMVRMVRSLADRTFQLWYFVGRPWMQHQDRRSALSSGTLRRRTPLPYSWRPNHRRSSARRWWNKQLGSNFVFWMLGSPETSRGAFSAVPKPIFASKYSLESSWRDLQDLHSFAPLRPENVSEFSSRIVLIFQRFSRKSTGYQQCSSEFHRLTRKCCKC